MSVFDTRVLGLKVAKSLTSDFCRATTPSIHNILILKIKRALKKHANHSAVDPQAAGKTGSR